MRDPGFHWKKTEQSWKSWMPSEIGHMNFKNAHKKEKVKTIEFYKIFFFFFLSTSQSLCFLEETKLSTLSSALTFFFFFLNKHFFAWPAVTGASRSPRGLSGCGVVYSLEKMRPVWEVAAFVSQGQDPQHQMSAKDGLCNKGCSAGTFCIIGRQG